MRNQINILLCVTSLMAFQCGSDDPDSMDTLEVTGLFGRWEIQDEVVNGGISDMLPRCCEFLEFIPDDNVNDYRGYLTFTDSQGLTNRGTFEVDIINQTVLFTDEENDAFAFAYSVESSGKNLTIHFTENRTDYTQVWVRKE